MPPALTSVIIPAYNQAQYLPGAVQSVLDQTYGDYDIIIVDDGSTDSTPQVAQRFGDRIRYIRQENQGLAGARNTGIRNATTEYVALLDSDDQWQPDYLSKMLALAERTPAAAVYHCRARCMDSEGHDLNQFLGGPIGRPETTYEALLRFDYLIPSTVLMRRSMVVEAGLFDTSLRSCEDWDLWLRLAPMHSFVGTWECMVRYRVHDSSLSADLSGMHQAAQAVIHKHFGEDDGQSQLWPADKRRAYGGLYRYQALSTVARQNDWVTCARHLARAFQADPTLAKDRDLFYDLAMGPQPLGYRGTAARLDLPSNATRLTDMVKQVFESFPAGDGQLSRVASGTAHCALGLLAYNTDHPAWCRRFLVRALLDRPELCRDGLVVGDLLRAFIGRTVIDKVRRPKHSLG